MTFGFAIGFVFYDNPLTRLSRSGVRRDSQDLRSVRFPSVIQPYEVRQPAVAFRMRIELPGERIPELPLHRHRMDAARDDIELVAEVVARARVRLRRPRLHEIHARQAFRRRAAQDVLALDGELATAFEPKRDVRNAFALHALTLGNTGDFRQRS